MGFKQKIYLVLSILLVVGYSIFTYFSYSDNTAIIQRNIQRNLSSIATNNADYMNVLFAEKLKTVHVSALTIGEYADNQQIIQRSIKTLAAGIKASAAYVGLENGAIFTSFEWSAPADFNVATRPWYALTKKNNKATIIDPYVDINNDYLSSITAPIFNADKQFVGALGVDITLDFFSERTKEVKVNGGYIFFLDNKHKLLGHPNTKLLGKKIEDVAPSLKKHIDKIYSQQTGSVEYHYNGVSKIMYFATVKLTGWKIIVAVDKGVAFKDVSNQAKNLIILSLIAVVLSLAVVIAFTSYLFKPFNQLADMIHDLAQGEGDLTKRLSISGKDEIAKIAQNVNAFIEKIQSLLIRAKESSAENASVATELSCTSTEVEKRVANEVILVDQTVATGAEVVESITNTVVTAKQNSQQMSQANDSLQLIRKDIQTLNSSLVATAKREVELAEMLNKTNENTSEVQNVLQVISDIAEQTNLLALNAAIEAARAGDQGRGFAVVASEVRELAERTQESLTGIHATIDVVVKSVSDVSKEINGAAQEMEEVSNMADNLQQTVTSNADVINTSISTNLKNVAAYEAVSEQVKQIIAQMEEVKKLADTNATSVDEFSNATEQLSRLTAELDKELGHFSL